MTLTTVPPVESYRGAFWPEDEGNDREFAQLTAETDVSSALHEAYLEARAIASHVEKPSEERLEEIHGLVNEWLFSDKGPFASNGGVYTFEDYVSEDYSLGYEKLDNLIDFVTAHVPEFSVAELQASRLFVRSTRSVYESTPKGENEIHPDANGSWGFFVPMRMSAIMPEYAEEVEMPIPVMRYVPPALRAAMLVGLPPFVITRYQPDAKGRRPYMFLVPGSPADRIIHIGDAGKAKEAGVILANRTVDFAYRRFGIRFAGLGATVPMETNFGQLITNPNVITTSGHGGTLCNIDNTIQKGLDEGRISEEDLKQGLGVAGLGSIGASGAEVLHARYPDAQMYGFDIRSGRAQTVMKRVGGIACGSMEELVEKSGVVVVALSPGARIKLGELSLAREKIEGTYFVDDSQPAALNDMQEVADFGATVVWPLGSDGGVTNREDFNYGNQVIDAITLMGCEAEIGAVYRFHETLTDLGYDEATRTAWTKKVAIRGPVTPQKAAVIGALFKLDGVGPAPLQAFGKRV